MRSPKCIIVLILLTVFVVQAVASHRTGDSVEVRRLIRQGFALSGSDERMTYELLGRALKLADSIQFQDDTVIQALVALADYETYHGKLDASIKFSLRALKYYEEHARIKEQIRTLSRVGDILRANGMYQNGYGYFYQALNLLKKYPDSTLLATVYNRMAACFFEDLSVDLDSTVKYAGMSLDISRKLNLLPRIFNNLNILGSVESKRKNYRAALKYYHEALPILLVSSPKEEPLILANMARNYELIRDYDKAEELSLKAVLLARKYAIPQYSMMGFMNLSSVYKAKGNYREALKYLDSANRLEFRLLSQRVLVQVQEFNNRIEMEKQAVLNKQLEYDQRITQSRFRIMLVLSILLFVVLISAGGFLIYQHRQRVRMHMMMTRLDQSNLVLRRFISILAHDLRSPFNSILGFSELLKEDKELTEKDRAQAINSLYSSSRSTFQLLERLLEWSRLQSGMMSPDKRSFDLNAQVREIFSLHEHFATKKEIALEFDAEGIVEIFADPDMVQTIIRNLVTNAIKFTRQGGKVTVTIETFDNTVVIKVKDTGVGMKPEVVGKLFRLEENYKSKGTAGEPGTGLGLILCKEYVDMHDGTIEVTSEPGVGSTFTVKLPIFGENGY